MNVHTVLSLVILVLLLIGTHGSTVQIYGHMYPIENIEYYDGAVLSSTRFDVIMWSHNDSQIIHQLWPFDHILNIYSNETSVNILSANGTFTTWNPNTEHLKSIQISKTMLIYATYYQNTGYLLTVDQDHIYSIYDSMLNQIVHFTREFSPHLSVMSSNSSLVLANQTSLVMVDLTNITDLRFSEIDLNKTIDDIQTSNQPDQITIASGNQSLEYGLLSQQSDLIMQIDDEISSIAWNNDFTRLAVGTRTGKIGVYYVAQEQIDLHYIAKFPIVSMKWNADNTELLFASDFGYVWNLQKGSIVNTFGYVTDPQDPFPITLVWSITIGSAVGLAIIIRILRKWL